MSDFTEALDCTPRGDFVSEKRVKKFSDQLEKGEKAHYVLAVNWIKINGEKKNPARQSLVLITDQNIHILIRKVTRGTDRNTIPLEKVQGSELNTGITSKKLVVDTKNDSVKFKINRPGKSECQDVAKFIRNIHDGSDKLKGIEEAEDKGYPIQASGANGQLTLHEDKIVITREGFSNKLIHGFKGKKEIPIDQITSIQFKEHGKLTAGYIQIGQSGYSESTGGVQDAVKDENSVTFRKNQAKFDRIKQKIDELRKRKNQSSDSSSAVNRLKERYAEGEITKEEYENKLEVLEESD